MNREFRPRLPQSEGWNRLIDQAREHGPEEVLNRFFRTFNSSKDEVDFSEDGLDYVIRSQSERIKTLDDLIEATDVDLDQYEVTRYLTNKYDQHSVEKGLVELFQVKAWLRKKYLDKPNTSYYSDWLDGLDKVVEKVSFDKSDTEGSVIIGIADLHVGAIVEGSRLVPDYNVDVIRDRLDYIAKTANSYNRTVHVKMLGDFIESFTGQNKKDTWKHIEKHGMEASLCAYDLISEFLQKLDNFGSIDIIGGNHDRITNSNDEDKSGQVAYLIAELLKRFTDADVRFDPNILTCQHDGVAYILTHGDKRITKAQPAKLILEYGDQNLYNVLLNAHGHEEKIHENSMVYQARQIPALCVPNHFATDNGWSSQSGFVVVQASERGGINFKTYSL